MKKVFPISRCGGFTLLEVLLAVATLSILGVLSMTVSQSYQSTNDLQLTSSGFAQMMRRAQVLAKTGISESAWWVQVKSDSIILFRGNDFDSRNTAYDEAYDVPRTIQIPGSLPWGPSISPPVPRLTYVYEASTWRLIDSGFVTMIDVANSQSLTLTTNAQGVISY